MSHDSKTREKKPMTLPYALFALGVTVVFVAVGMIAFKLHLQTMMFFAWPVVALFVYLRGTAFSELENLACGSVVKAIPACMIMFGTGAMIAAWISSGTVSTLIYIGLKVCTPSFFLIVTFLLSAVVSVSTGTSWGTIGTVGIAMLGVAYGLNIPMGITAGALVSGSFFGDKMSPVSDSTNLAAASAGTPVMSHVKSMLYTTVPAFIISGILYTIIGLKYGSAELDPSSINELLAAISSSMKISWITLLPAVFFLCLLIRGVSAVLAIMLSALAGFAVAILYQGGDITVVGKSLYSGVVQDFGNELINKLLHRGGMTSMYSTVAIVIIAVGLGGFLQHSGILQIIVDSVAKKVSKVWELTVATMLSSYLGNLVTGSNNFAMVMTGTLFGPLYKEMRIKPQTLSRVLEDCGTMGCPLIPWNVNAVYVINMLQVPWAAYAPYCFLNYIVPIFTLIYGFTGFAIFKYSDEEWEELTREESIISLAGAPTLKEQPAT